MLQATTTLETTSTQGAKLTAPKRQFVLLENWDEAAYGPVSEQTVVERKVFGVLKKGVYRMTGKAGHYEVEDYDSQALTERTVEHVNDGESSLQAEGLQTKKEALQGAFREAGAEHPTSSRHWRDPLSARHSLVEAFHSLRELLERLDAPPRSVAKPCRSLIRSSWDQVSLSFSPLLPSRSRAFSWDPALVALVSSAGLVQEGHWDIRLSLPTASTPSDAAAAD